MKKALVIQYTPRKQRSRTKRILETFKSHIVGHEIETIDIEANLPPLFNEANLSAYYKRNYGGEILTSVEAESIQKFDFYIEQVKSADIIIVAYPMFNFSMPAAVKAFFDGILLKGETWDINESGYVGLLKDKEMVLLTTSGGDYSSGTPMESWDLSTVMIKQFASFVGIKKLHIVAAQGLAKAEKEEEIIAKAENQAAEVASLISK